MYTYIHTYVRGMSCTFNQIMPKNRDYAPVRATLFRSLHGSILQAKNGCTLYHNIILYPNKFCSPAANPIFHGGKAIIVGSCK